jgi:hypothetical protein
MDGLARARNLAFLIAGSIMMLASPMRGDIPPEKQAKLNGGYYLLHQVSTDEKQVPMLFLVKHAPTEISTYADRISKTAGETLDRLDHLQDGDSAIHFDHNPLPQIEQDARASIKADKQHQLLFGTTDSEFVRAFLISQIEACTYAVNLSKTLADQETNPDRVQALRHISAKWLGMRNDAFRLLRDY